MQTRAFSVLTICLGIIALVNPAAGWSAIDSADWVYVGAPLGDANLRSMIVAPDDDELWYLGSQGNGVYVTRDAGSSWEQHISGNIGSMAMDPTNHDIVYASSGSDLYRSTDRGATWDPVFSFPNPIAGPSIDSPTFIDSLLVSEIDGTIVVGLTSQFHTARVYTSDDDGETWDISFESGSGFHFWDIAEIPTDGTWFFCTEDSAHMVNSVVMRSTDRGLTWDEMIPLAGIPTAGHGLNIQVHSSTQAVYFLTESGCMASSADSGDTWSPYDCLDFGMVLLIDPNLPNRFFGGESVRGVKEGGVYFSEDTGETFTFIGLTDRTIAALELNGDSTTLFAVAHGEGIYKLSLEEDLIQVSIDIRPWIDRNRINPFGRCVTPVAILGSRDFDVRDVDASTLTFGPAGALAIHDLTDKLTYLAHLKDVNRDGFMDLLSHYRTRDTGIACGDKKAMLNGELLGGRPFYGVDTIKCVPFRSVRGWCRHGASWRRCPPAGRICPEGTQYKVP